MESRIASVEAFCLSDFDFLVIGGGTAGLAVASRLSQSGTFSVGVLEAGTLAQDDDRIEIPAFYGRSLNGEHDWKFVTKAQPGLGGRRLPWPRGKVLGGTSALNFMTWNRGCREDYDAWEKLGNPGWGWDSFLPFFKRSETFHPPSEELKATHDVSHDPGAFGTSGPIQISYSNEYSASHGLWHSTLNKLGIPTNPAHTSGSNVGVWTNLNAVDPRTSRRSYSVDYVKMLPAHAKLSILCSATVEKILLEKEEDRCIARGVRFQVDGKKYEVSARKEVVLSGGSVASPQILELSGIGNPDVLKEAGIDAVVDSPMVGERLQEHIMLTSIFEVDPTLANPDDLVKDEAVAAEAMEKYLKDRSGRLTILPCSICYIPFNRIIPDSRLEELYHETETLQSYDEESRSILRERLDGTATLGQMEYIFHLGNWSPSFEGESGKKYGTLLQILQYPFSVGSIHVKSSSPSEPPGIHPAYYEAPHGELDLRVMQEAMSFGRRITETEPLARVIREPAWPPADTVDDHYRAKQWIADKTITDWHPVGTCSMGGRGGIKAGVVDERLRVYGVERLRVIDASVMPLQISGHLQATIYAIAEKGASMILDDHGLSL